MLVSIRQAIHDLLHDHKLLTRGLEELVICGDRWPWGKATIYYRPHAHKEWETMTVEEFKTWIAQ